MKSEHRVSFETHKDVHPSNDEINEALVALVRKKIGDAEKQNDRRVSTFSVKTTTMFK